jgi:hypothetical protein
MAIPSSLVVPGLQALFAFLGARRERAEEKAGLAGQVEKALDAYTGKDEKLVAVLMGEIEKARQHDAATLEREDRLVNRLRGLVRPVVTLVAFAWYVLARVCGIPLMAEDYAIVGGILAFWFGFRPFEKDGGRS